MNFQWSPRDQLNVTSPSPFGWGLGVRLRQVCILYKIGCRIMCLHFVGINSGHDSTSLSLIRHLALWEEYWGHTCLANHFIMWLVFSLMLLHFIYMMVLYALLVAFLYIWLQLTRATAVSFKFCSLQWITHLLPSLILSLTGWLAM